MSYSEHSTSKPFFDVIISGAGPVGLFLACELALADCSVLVLEKNEDPHSPLKRLPFGIRGLSLPTIEALDRRDLLSKLEIYKRLKNPHQNAGKGGQRQAGHFAGIPFLEADVDLSRFARTGSGAGTYSLISEMEELEAALTLRAQNLGVQIKRGFTVTKFSEYESSVTVSSGEHTFNGQWLVGCDGGRSQVRKLAAFDFVGTEPEFTGYSVSADLADPEKLRPGRNLTAHGMYLQSQPGFVVIQDFDRGEFHSSDQKITREHIQTVLRRISETDVTITELHFASCWTDRARQVTRYRKGRVLLAGDAAHIHSPLGGQGLNLGIGDAMNLGWKLAAVLKSGAKLRLLDTYEKERHPLGAQVLDWSRAQVHIMKPDPAARALNSVVRDLMLTRDGASYFAGKVWGVFTQYDLESEHELVGKSAPNLILENGETVNERLRSSRAILLDFNANLNFKLWSEKYGDRVKYCVTKERPEIQAQALLIRPDGYIAWATDMEFDEAGLDEAVSHWSSS